MSVQPDIHRHVCVFGVGGVGGYFGGRLAWWLASQTAPTWHVHFVARGAHLAAIDSRGLELDTPGARLTCVPASASSDMKRLPVPDVVLLCVKGYGLDEALRQIAAHCGEDAVVIPLLNGVDIHERIRVHLPKARVLPACVFVGTHVDRPGVVSQAGGDGVIVLGGDPDDPDFVPVSFLSLLEDAGIRFTWFDDPRPAIWEKYVFISALRAGDRRFAEDPRRCPHRRPSPRGCSRDHARGRQSRGSRGCRSRSRSRLHCRGQGTWIPLRDKDVVSARRGVGGPGRR